VLHSDPKPPLCIEPGPRLEEQRVEVLTPSLYVQLSTRMGHLLR
jgi:hypothetical protein